MTLSIARPAAGALWLLSTLTTSCIDPSRTRSASEGVGGDAAATDAGSDGGTGVWAQPDAVPTPPTTGVAKPSADTDSPNLRVLPWAGFTAAISYTFDDSQPSQKEHWPELKATGVPLTFFINPSGKSQAGYTETWTEVAASGAEIGNHTWTHCHAALSDCTPVGTAEQEIDQTSDYIVQQLAVPAVISFASPFGDTGWNQYASSRFLLGRGVQGGMIAPSGAADWYNLPCIGVTEGQTAQNFNASIDSALAQGKWAIFLFHSIRPTSNDWYAGVEIADITQSLEHAVSLGEVWADTMGAVGAYVRAQQMFEALTPADNTWTWSLPEHFPPGKLLRVQVDGGSLSQAGHELSWDDHGYYEVALDTGKLTWAP